MDHRLIALKLLTRSSDDLVNVGSGGKASRIDYADLAFNIFLKFVDVLEGVGIIIIGIFVMRYVRSYLTKIETAHERQRTALNLFEKITSGFILVISITLGLKVIGLDLTLLVSVMTLGLSFGLGDVVKNYVAGLLILFKSPFEIGDVVMIRNFTGRVERIEFQSVTLRTFDKKEITVQNSDLLTQSITNFSKSNIVRMDVPLSLGYGSDVRRALAIFERILQNNPAVLKQPKHMILVKTLSANSVDVLMRFWVQKPCRLAQIKSDITLHIQEAFDEENILPPYVRELDYQGGEFGLTESRKQRLRIFYGQPILADIATKTAEEIAAIGAALTPQTTTPAAVPAEELGDIDEPE